MTLDYSIAGDARGRPGGRRPSLGGRGEPARRARGPRICVYMCISVYVYVCVYIYIYILYTLFVYMYICIMCIYIYIYIYIHSYTLQYRDNWGQH